MIVLDTDIVTLLSYGQTEKLREKIRAVNPDEALAVTVIAYMEILGPRYDNIYKAANAEEMQRAIERFRDSKAMLDDFELMYHNDDSYRRFESLLNAKKGKKKQKDRADMMIASSALTRDALLVTRNVKDYKDVPDLWVENWAD